MNYFCYIDVGNKSDIVHLKGYPNVRYYAFFEKNQKDIIKCDPGTKIKRIRCEHEGKQYLDCKLIDFFLKRINTENTVHYIVSKDQGYDKFINFVNKKNGNICNRIIDLSVFD